MIRFSGFDWPMAVFCGSALWGLGIGADRGAAWIRFGFVGLGVGLYYLLSRAPSIGHRRGPDVAWLNTIIGVAPAFLAFYFLVANDWAQPVEKNAWMEPLRGWLSQYQLGVLPHPHPNVVGGALAMLVPLQFAALRPGSRDFSHAQSYLVLVLLGVSCVGLVLSGLRGAWLALAGALGARLWWRASRRLSGTRGGPLTTAIWCAGGCVIVIAVAVTWGARWLAMRPDRVLVWQNSWALAWDYAFTGLGLGGFTLAYSSYALLIHVPYVTHAHNLFLDIWLEHGIAGLWAFAWLLLLALRSVTSRVAGSPAPAGRRRPPGFRSAALTALLVMTLHGLVDDIYYGYGGIGTVMLFVPVGLLARHEQWTTSGQLRLRRRARLVPWGGAVVTVTFSILFVPGTRALCQANLGALLQTRAELSLYRWPRWPIQDALRHSALIDLTPAIWFYRAALKADPANVQANRRLGQIELSRGHYDVARRYLHAAYQAAPDHHAARQMFGESLALTGDVRGAAGLWRALPLDQDQLAIRQAWYDIAADPRRAQFFREAVRLAGAE